MILTIWPGAYAIRSLPRGCFPLSLGFLLIRVLVFVLKPLERRNSQFSGKESCGPGGSVYMFATFCYLHGRELCQILLHSIWRTFHSPTRRAQGYTPSLQDRIQASGKLLQARRGPGGPSQTRIDRGPRRVCRRDGTGSSPHRRQPSQHQEGG